MAKVKVGETYGTMIVSNVNPGGWDCKMACSKCGYVGRYNKYSVEEYKKKNPCRRCAELGSLKIGYKIGNYEITKIKYESAIDIKPSEITWWCNQCKKLFSESSLEKIRKVSIECPICHGKKIESKVKNIPDILQTSKSSKTVTKSAPVKIEATKEAEKRKFGTGYFMANNKVSIEDNSDAMVGQIYGTLKVISVVKEKIQGNITSTARVVCECTECGVRDTYDKYKVRRNEAQCKTCRKMDSLSRGNNSDNIGDYTLTHVNGLKIIKQSQNERGIWIGEYKCTVCNKTGQAPLSLLLDKKVLCPECMNINNRPIMTKFFCPECGYQDKLSYRTLYGGNTKAYRCSRCGIITDLKLELDLQNDKETIKAVLSRYKGKGLGITSTDFNSRLVKFGDVFINRDGERCYNCLCIEHRQELVLSQDEIDTFQHKQCTCKDAEFYQLLKIPVKNPRKDDLTDLE